MLDETLDMDTKSRKVIGEEIIETEEPALLKIKQDSAKFVASGLGKAKYSSRSEHTGADGEPLFDNDTKNKSKKAISEFVADENS